MRYRGIFSGSEDVEPSTNDARVSRDSLQNDDVELSNAKVVVSDTLVC